MVTSIVLLVFFFKLTIMNTIVSEECSARPVTAKGSILLSLHMQWSMSFFVDEFSVKRML